MMACRRPPPATTLLGFFLVFALLSQNCVNALVPGGRLNACFFTLNNTLYVFGGKRMDATSNPFLSTPLPLVVGVTSNWTPVPMPPGGQAWGDSLELNNAPQIDCASTKSGKVFFFGGPAGFASFNLATNQWDTTPPTFGSADVKFANLKDQTAVRAAVHPDGTTISIVTATAYLKFDSISNTIVGMHHNMKNGIRGFCLTVVPDLNLPVICGGISSEGYHPFCLSFSLSGPTIFGPQMLAGEAGCLLFPYRSGMILIPGYLQTYENNQAPGDNSPNPQIHFLSGDSSQPWVNITNLNTGMFSIRTYAQGLVVPGTNTAVIYGGAGPRGTLRDDFHIIDLTKQTWLSRVDPIPGAFISQSLSPTTTGTDPAGPTGSSTISDKSSSTPAIVGGTVGAAVTVALIAGLAFFIIRRRKNTRHGKHTQIPSHEESIHLEQNFHGSSDPSRANSTIAQTPDMHYSQQLSAWSDADHSKSMAGPNSPPIKYSPVGESPGRRINTVQDTSKSTEFQAMSPPPRNPQLAPESGNSYH